MNSTLCSLHSNVEWVRTKKKKKSMSTSSSSGSSTTDDGVTIPMDVERENSFTIDPLATIEMQHFDVIDDKDIIWYDVSVHPPNIDTVRSNLESTMEYKEDWDKLFITLSNVRRYKVQKNACGKVSMVCDSRTMTDVSSTPEGQELMGKSLYSLWFG